MLNPLEKENTLLATWSYNNPGAAAEVEGAFRKQVGSFLKAMTYGDIENCLHGDGGSCLWAAASVTPAKLLRIGHAVKAADEVDEGIYIVRGAGGDYVGQSGSIARRFEQHVRSGKFTGEEVGAAERIHVPGGKTQREVAEQLKIDELGGIGNLLNRVNPIGPRRVDLMPNQPYVRR